MCMLMCRGQGQPALSFHLMVFRDQMTLSFYHLNVLNYSFVPTLEMLRQEDCCKFGAHLAM